MWRKFFLSILFLLMAASMVTAQEKDYHAQRFDVDVVVEEDGSLLVTETVVFDFVGGPFTFVFRELETEHTDGINGIEAFVDGRPLARGDQSGQVEIESGDPIRVTWHLEPFSNAERTFELRYRMLGVVRRQENADLLIYQFLPDEYEYPIAESVMTLRYPPTAQINGDVRVTTGNGEWQRFDNEVRVTAQRLNPDETLVMEVPFAPGTLIAQPPAWQQRQMAQRESGPLWIAAAAGLLVGGMVLLLTVYRRYRPDAARPPHLVFEPPSDLPPAIGGTLNNSGAEPGWANALATLFSLADRGVLRIEELDEKSWFRRHEYAIQRIGTADNLRPHEEGLLDVLFTDKKKGRTDSVKLSKLSERVSSRQWKEHFVKPLKAELKAAGFISQERKKARQLLITVGVILLFAGLGVVIAAIGFENPWMMALAGSLFLLGLIVAITGSELPPLTDEGASQAAVWKQFGEHLKAVTKGKASVAGPDMFRSFLPYAASYGLLQAWAKWFEKEGWTELPPYFEALAHSSASDSVAAFVAMTAASNSAGGSAAGAAGAGAGAAGGGASGAG